MTLNIAAGSSQIIDFLYKNIYVYVGKIFKKKFLLTQKAEGQVIKLESGMDRVRVHGKCPQKPPTYLAK